mmetsp:Transcript_12397/g.35216  ORF Transcript_12397/g.35216 Transcript_12397/m.35216 type:complete len:260 (-) Transcript_12397:156-935(-)
MVPVHAQQLQRLAVDEHAAVPSLDTSQAEAGGQRVLNAVAVEKVDGQMVKLWACGAPPPGLWNGVLQCRGNAKGLPSVEGQREARARGGSAYGDLDPHPRKLKGQDLRVPQEALPPELVQLHRLEDAPRLPPVILQLVQAVPPEEAAVHGQPQLARLGRQLREDGQVGTVVPREPRAICEELAAQAAGELDQGLASEALQLVRIDHLLALKEEVGQLDLRGGAVGVGPRPGVELRDLPLGKRGVHRGGEGQEAGPAPVA